MGPLWFGFLLTGVLGSRPPNQTAVQRNISTNYAKVAKNAEPAGRAKLLKALDGTTFRSEVKALPFLANASASDLLAMYHTEIWYAHLMHTVPYSYALFEGLTKNPKLGASFEQIEQLGYIPTLWKFLADGSLAWRQDFEYYNERETKGLKYPNIHLPKPSATEAMDRPTYTAINVWKRAAGNIEYGNVTFFLDLRYTTSYLFISPIDTGQYYSKYGCGYKSPHDFQDSNSNFKHHQDDGDNDRENVRSTTTDSDSGISCSAWDGVGFGTRDNYDHLLLPHIDFWGFKLSQLYQRWYAEPTPPVPLPPGVTAPKYVHYFEGLLSGAFLVPEDLKYMVVHFPAFFGTLRGRHLQNFAEKISRPLGWANDYDSAIVMDPVVNKLHGVYLPTAQDIKVFNTSWSKPIPTWNELDKAYTPRLHLHLMGYVTHKYCTDLPACQSSSAHCRFLGVNNHNPRECIYWKD